VTSYCLVDGAIGDYFLTSVRYLYLFHRFHSGSIVQPASYLMGKINSV